MSRDAIVVLGTGALGSALARGMAQRDELKERLFLVDIDAQRARGLAEALGLNHGSMDQLNETVSMILVAVKPVDVESALDGCVDQIGAQTAVVSCAAGVELASLERACRGKGLHLRAMPNVAARLSQSTVGLVAAPRVDDDVVDRVKSVLESIGQVWRLRSESQMHAVTALGGSGPAFAALVTEALIDGAVEAGLPRDLAGELGLQMLRGTLALLDQGILPADLRRSVSSPGGTTVAGLAVLQSRGTREAVADAVIAAAKRSREMAGD